jgi:hypothetical protein
MVRHVYERFSHGWPTLGHGLLGSPLTVGHRRRVVAVRDQTVALYRAVDDQRRCARDPQRRYVTHSSKIERFVYLRTGCQVTCEDMHVIVFVLEEGGAVICDGLGEVDQGSA